MTVIRNPLSALGAVVVLIEAISASALWATQSLPTLQRILVIVIAATSSLFVGAVIFLVVYLAITNPALLFNPKDIDRSAHRDIYIKHKDKIKATLDDQKSSE